MRKPRFKTIFSRMLFLQCMTVIGILLVVGIAVIIVVLSQSITAKEKLLSSKCDLIAQSMMVSQQEGVKVGMSVASQHELLVQINVGDDPIDSYYQDEKWADVSKMSKLDADYVSISDDAANTTQFRRGYFRGHNDFSVLTAYRTFTANEQAYMLLIHADISDVNTAAWQLSAWVFIFALTAIVIAVFCSYYVTSRIINPFVEINHTVQCYSRGDFSKRINLVGRDEAAQLGKSFNDMAEQLRNLEATRRSFVANVSHELRSPLTSMKGFLEAMHDGIIPEHELRQYIALVLDETKRMTVMVNDLLDLARIESGTILLNYETFDINELIRRTLITFEARIVERHIDLDVRFAQEQCNVYADSTQISQVLRNLIDNAIKYSPDGRIIYISSYALRKEVYVSIKDNGIGIPPEDIPHVFDRFYKVEKAHTPSPQVGSGLGLSIVKRIIEQHGQTITVRSAKGKGTQFTFSLQKAPLLKRQFEGGKRNGQGQD